MAAADTLFSESADYKQLCSAVATNRVRGDPGSDQPVAAVDADVVIIAEGRHRHVDPLRAILGRLRLRPLDRSPRIPILMGELGWPSLPGVGQPPRLQIRFLGLGVASIGRCHHRGIDDLPAHRQETGLPQASLVGVKQHLDRRLARDLGQSERLAEEPDRVGIRHRVGQLEGEEAHREKPLIDQEFGALVRQRVAGLQDPHLEHEHEVEWWATTLRSVRAGNGTGEAGPERLEIDDAAQPLRRVARGREILQTLIDVEKTGLTAYRCSSPIADPITLRNSTICEIF